MFKINSFKVISILLLVVGIFVFCRIWNLYFTQEFVGSWLGGLDPKRQEHLEQVLNKKSSKQLLSLLEHGDFNKAAVAESLLAQRAPRELFDPIAEKLHNDSERVRMAARRILPYIDKKKASQFLIRDLEKFAEDSDDYQDMLSILAYHKQSEVYPLLIKFTNKPNAWNSAIASYFQDLGNPDAIPILKKLYKTIPVKDNFSTRTERERIEKAIKTLETIKNNPQAVSGDELSKGVAS